jgi:hypothetical protein
MELWMYLIIYLLCHVTFVCNLMLPTVRIMVCKPFSPPNIFAHVLLTFSLKVEICSLLADVQHLPFDKVALYTTEKSISF